MKKTKGIKVVLLDDVKSVIFDALNGDDTNDIKLYKAGIALIDLLDKLSVELNNVTEAAVRSGEVYMTEQQTKKEEPKKEEQIKPKEKSVNDIDEKDLVKLPLMSISSVQENIFKVPRQTFMLEVLSETDNKVSPPKRKLRPVIIVGYNMYITDKDNIREVSLARTDNDDRYTFSLYSYGTKWRLWEKK